jgi:hypothetical protein
MFWGDPVPELTPLKRNGGEGQETLRPGLAPASMFWGGPVSKPTPLEWNVGEGQETLRPGLAPASMFRGDPVPPDPPGLLVPPRTRTVRRLVTSLSLLLLLPGPWLLAQEAAPKVELIERVVAVVDERPLLLSDVRALALVRRLAPDDALQAVIDERLMHAEAAHVAQAEVSPAQEDAALAALLEKSPALRTSVPEPDLRRLLRRQLAILQYVEFRFRPQIHVSDEEVRRAWALEPTGPALEDAVEAIRARLERRMLDERIEAWVQELRTRADVRQVGAPLPRSF